MAQGGLLTGASIALLSLASVLGIASYSVAMLAGFVPAIFFLKGLPKMGRLVYIATALLSVFIVPDKEVALSYSLFFGLYTVIKYEIERLHKRPLEIVLKLTCAAIWAVLTMWIIRLGFLPEIQQFSKHVTWIVLIGWVVFLIYYDICLSCIFCGMARMMKRFHV